MKRFLLSVAALPLGAVGAGVGFYALTGEADSALLVTAFAAILGIPTGLPVLLLWLKLGWTSVWAAMIAGGLTAAISFVVLTVRPSFDEPMMAVFVLLKLMMDLEFIAIVLGGFFLPGAIGGLIAWAWLRVTRLIPGKPSATREPPSRRS